MAVGARHLILITFVGTVVLFTNLGGPRLWDRDEPRNAGCAAEMSARGDWVTPVFNDELRTHKPILLYWLLLTAYGLFGVNEFAARFWSALLGIGTAVLTYGIGRRVFSPTVGVWSAIILVTTLMFDVAGRAATPDSLLIFWTTAAICVYVWGTFPATGDSRERVVTAPMRWFPTWPVAAFMYACMGMAVLAKGPVGLVLPTAVIGMYLLVSRLQPAAEQGSGGRRVRVLRFCWSCLRPFGPRHFLRTCWLMRPITALCVAMAVALPWYVAVDLRTDGQWVRGFLLDHNFGRAAQSLEGHGGSILYYPVALLIGFFPWSVFAVPTLLEVVRRIRRRDDRSAGYVLAVCWMGVTIGLFSVARTKLPSYITPCYPAVALLVGSFVHAWTKGVCLSAPFWPRLALASLATVGVVMIAAIPMAAARYLPGDEWLAVIGLIPLLTAVATFLVLRRGRSQPTVGVTFALGAVLFTTSLFALGAARVDRHQSFGTLAEMIRQHSVSPEIGALGVLEPSWVFYTGRPIDPLFVPELEPHVPADQLLVGTPRTKGWEQKPSINAWYYLKETPDRFVITTRQILDRIGTMPAHVEILAETPYFLKRDRLVLLMAGRSMRETAARPDTVPVTKSHR